MNYAIDILPVAPPPLPRLRVAARRQYSKETIR